MKKFILSFLLIGFGMGIYSQEADYLTKLNIPYYDDSVNAADAYIRERCVLDIYYPKGIKDFATVVWIHSGGLTSGDKEIPEALKGKGFCVVSLGYRLSPKVQSPTYIEDAAAGVAWVFNHIGELGGDPSMIFVSGHSAGGYLTCMIGLDKRWLNVHRIDANRIAGLISLSGQAITHFTIRHERGIEDTRPIVDNLAPLYHVRPDAPPLWLITGDRNDEMLGRYEENAYLYRMMTIVGHKATKLYELQGYGHGMTEPAFPLLIREVQLKIKEKNGLN